MGPFILPEAQPVSEQDSVEATLEAFGTAAGRGVYHACDHYYLYLLERLSPMQVLEHLLHVAIPKNQIDDHYFLFPVFTWRALEYFGWDYARYLGRAPVRYVTRPTMPASLDDVDGLIAQFGLLERDLRFASGEDETASITALADAIGRCSKFSEVPGLLARARRRPVAGGRRRGALRGRLDALLALADRQPDGRAHQHGRQHPALSAAAARAVAAHEAAGAPRVAHRTRGAHGPADAGPGRPARARARGGAAAAHTERSPGGHRGPHRAAAGG